MGGEEMRRIRRAALALSALAAVLLAGGANWKIP